MKVDYKRIWFACWVFGILLAAISLMVALVSNNLYFVYVAVGFLVVHFVGFVKYIKFPVVG